MVVSVVIAGESWVVAGLVRDWQNPVCNRPEPFGLVASHEAGVASIPW
jgi:hypothetical protein